MNMANLTKEDFLEIEKKLGYVINNWYNDLINTIISVASKEGVKKLYWNTSKTLSAGGINDAKKNFFYETLPNNFGFKKEKQVLRNKTEEEFWVKNLQKNSYASEGLIPLELVPKAYQGAVIGILKGNRGPYTKEELSKVLKIIKEGKERKRDLTKEDYFTYNSSAEWKNAQRFSDANEMIIKQKLSSELVSHILETGSPATKVFLSNLITPSQHFDSDVIGWALVAKISPEEWVINQVQTDTINDYREAKKEALGGEKRRERVLSKESIIDRLDAANKFMWSEKANNDESFLRMLQNNISTLQSLPTNDQLQESGLSVDAWWSQNNARMINTREANSFNLSRFLVKSSKKR